MTSNHHWQKKHRDMQSPSGDRNPSCLVQESPMTNLARQLMEVHIQERTGIPIRRANSTGSDESLYFSARSTQSICDEDGVSLSSPEENRQRTGGTIPLEKYQSQETAASQSRAAKVITEDEIQFANGQFESRLIDPYDGGSDSSDTLAEPGSNDSACADPVFEDNEYCLNSNKPAYIKGKCEPYSEGGKLDESLLKKIDPLYAGRSRENQNTILGSSEKPICEELAELMMTTGSQSHKCSQGHESVSSNIQDSNQGDTHTGGDPNMLIDVSKPEMIKSTGSLSKNTVLKKIKNGEEVSKESMIHLVKQLDSTLENLICSWQKEEEKNQIRTRVCRAEQDRFQSELFKIETSYGQLHDRYEKLRSSLDEAIQLSETWKTTCEDREKQLEHEQDRFQELRERCEDKLSELMREMDTMKQDHEIKMRTLNTSLRKTRLTVDELNKTLDMKNQQIEKLNRLCDDALRLRK